MKKEGNSKNLEISCLTSTARLIKVEKLSGLKPSGRARKREVGVTVGTILIWFTKGFSFTQPLRVQVFAAQSDPRDVFPPEQSQQAVPIQ